MCTPGAAFTRMEAEEWVSQRICRQQLSSQAQDHVFDIFLRRNPSLGPFLYFEDLLTLSWTCKRFRPFASHARCLNRWSSHIQHHIRAGFFYSSLGTLQLGRLQMSTLQLYELARACETPGAFPNVQFLDLSSNGISSKKAAKLMGVLGRSCVLPNLRAVELSFNPLGSQGAGDLQALLSRRKLQYLGLYSCALKSMGGLLLVNALQNIQVSQLRSLRLGKNDLGDFAANNVLNALTESCAFPHLEELDLSFNKLSAEGITAFLKGEGRSKLYQKLRRFTLSGNPLLDDGVTIISELLQPGALPRLEVLHISGTGIGTKGVQGLMTALENGACRNLHYLSLSHNRLGDDGGKAVGNMLIRRSSIKNARVNLSFCRIGEEGIRVLTSALVGAGLDGKAVELTGNPF